MKTNCYLDYFERWIVGAFKELQYLHLVSFIVKAYSSVSVIEIQSPGVPKVILYKFRHLYFRKLKLREHLYI